MERPLITASAICREQGEPVTAAMARQLAPLKSQTVRCDAWQMKSQRLVVRIRYQLVVDVSIVLRPSVTARMCTSRR
nr:MAG TPA: hypothetical protein [Caudoviricetes sp.]